MAKMKSSSGSKAREGGARKGKGRAEDSSKVQAGMEGFNPDVTVPVTFGGQSARGEFVRLAMRFSVANMPPSKAVRVLCGRQVRVLMVCDPNAGEDLPDQKKLFEDADIRLAAIADINGFGTKPKGVSATLVFKASAVDVGEVVKFSGSSGYIALEVLGAAGAPTEKDEKVQAQIDDSAQSRINRIRQSVAHDQAATKSEESTSPNEAGDSVIGRVG